MFSMLVEVGKFERAETGDDQSQMVLARLGWVKKAAFGDKVDSLAQFMEIGIRRLQWISQK